MLGVVPISGYGRTWRLLPREAASDSAGFAWQYPPLRLSNGDVVRAEQQRPLKAEDVKLPQKPAGRLGNYLEVDHYRVEDLPLVRSLG